MRIAVDLDGTLADIHTVFLEELERTEGIKHSFEDLETYYFEKSPFTTEKFHEIARKNWNNQSIPLTDSSLPNELNRLAQDHTVDIVTARGDVNQEKLKNWLVSKGIDFDSFIVDKAKTDLEYDVLIDDCPKYSEKGMNLLLYDRPYNRNAEESENTWRVKNFKEIRTHIEQKLV